MIRSDDEFLVTGAPQAAYPLPSLSLKSHCRIVMLTSGCVGPSGSKSIPADGAAPHVRENSLRSTSRSLVAMTDIPCRRWSGERQRTGEGWRPRRGMAAGARTSDVQIRQVHAAAPLEVDPIAARELDGEVRQRDVVAPAASGPSEWAIPEPAGKMLGVERSSGRVHQPKSVYSRQFFGC